MSTGFLLIHKPAGISSFYCVKRIKKLLGDKKLKIGHGGTLDPFATGLLIVGVGRSATRHLDLLLKVDKKYKARAKLGELRDTLDLTGEIIAGVGGEREAGHEQEILPESVPALGQSQEPVSRKLISQESLVHSYQALGAGYTQTPPIYSACKFSGVRLYALAREGRRSEQELAELADSKKRFITLHSVELLDFSYPYFTIQAHVSHGTYIRSLMDDIARGAGSCATTYELERTQVGPFKLADAVAFDLLDSPEAVLEHLMPVDQFLAQFGKE
jgi:tRNA pseudouridine55 synthase